MDFCYFTQPFCRKKFQGTCSPVKVLKEYVVERNVGNPCFTIVKLFISPTFPPKKNSAGCSPCLALNASVLPSIVPVEFCVASTGSNVSVSPHQQWRNQRLDSRRKNVVEGGTSQHSNPGVVHAEITKTPKKTATQNNWNFSWRGTTFYVRLATGTACPLSVATLHIRLPIPSGRAVCHHIRNNLYAFVKRCPSPSNFSIRSL